MRRVGELNQPPLEDSLGGLPSNSLWNLLRKSDERIELISRDDFALVDGFRTLVKLFM